MSLFPQREQSPALGVGVGAVGRPLQGRNGLTGHPEPSGAAQAARSAGADLSAEGG